MMVSIFWRMVLNCWALFVWSPTAACVTLLGRMLIFTSRLEKAAWNFGARIPLAIFGQTAPPKSRSSSTPAAGGSDVRLVRTKRAVITLPVRKHSRSRARARPAPSITRRIRRWTRERESRIRWMAWVAQNLYR